MVSARRQEQIFFCFDAKLKIPSYIPGPKLPLVVPVPCGTGSGVHLARPTRRMAKGLCPPKAFPLGEGAAAYAATDEGPSFSRPSRGRRICQRCSALRGDGKDTHPTGRSASSRLYFSPPGNFFPLPPSNRVKDGRVSRHYGAVPHRPYQKSKEGSYETRLRPAPHLHPGAVRSVGLLRLCRPAALSAQPVTISEEEMMRYDLGPPPSGPPCLNLGWTC